jgi:hypothetical protein
LYFLLISLFIKLRLGALVGTLIVVIIKLFIVKVIRILNFNYMFIPSVSSKSLKGLIEFYIIHLAILKFINIIYSLLSIF